MKRLRLIHHFLTLGLVALALLIAPVVFALRYKSLTDDESEAAPPVPDRRCLRPRAAALGLDVQRIGAVGAAPGAIWCLYWG